MFILSIDSVFHIYVLILVPICQICHVSWYIKCVLVRIFLMFPKKSNVSRYCTSYYVFPTYQMFPIDYLMVPSTLDLMFSGKSKSYKIVPGEPHTFPCSSNVSSRYLPAKKTLRCHQHHGVQLSSVINTTESSSAVSSTTRSPAQRCHQQHGVQLSSVINTTESSAAVSSTPWSQAPRSH